MNRKGKFWMNAEWSCIFPNLPEGQHSIAQYGMQKLNTVQNISSPPS
jgi:hypothetical protein